MGAWIRRVVRYGIIISLLVLIVVGVASLAVRQLAIREAKQDFPPPGRLIELEGRLHHLHCAGDGTPTVVLESGLDDWGSWGWSGLQEDLARITRVCSYDRAGMIWSEAGKDPRDAEHIATELHALLSAASESAPYVMVGHSLGALYALVFDHRYPGEVAGFVLVDPAHPQQEDRFPAEISARMREGDAEKPPRWLVRVVTPYRMFAPERPTPRTAYWWRSMPEGVLGEVAAVQTTFAQSRRTGPLGHRPLIVLTSGIKPELPGLSAAVNAEFQRTLMELHEELVGLSTNAVHRVVDGAGHYIHMDQPETVLEAVRDAVMAVRTKAPLN